MYKRIFIDANIWLDYLDRTRINHGASKKSIDYCLAQALEIFTSCDIITTIYYINNKFDKVSALDNIQRINYLCEVVEFSNSEIEQTCLLMKNDGDYCDLEDTIQYILALKEQCDLILSNDKKFVSKEIAMMSSEAFCKKVGLK